MGVAALLSWVGTWHEFLPIDFVAIMKKFPSAAETK
jgi:hypothetical protein